MRVTVHWKLEEGGRWGASPLSAAGTPTRSGRSSSRIGGRGRRLMELPFGSLPAPASAVRDGGVWSPKGTAPTPCLV